MLQFTCLTVAFFYSYFFLFSLLVDIISLFPSPSYSKYERMFYCFLNAYSMLLEEGNLQPVSSTFLLSQQILSI